MRVKVYRNLRRKCYSIQYKGRVIEHARQVTLLNVRFHVNENGRQRVLKTGHKNVHAYAIGVWTEQNIPHTLNGRVTYNPFRDGSFYNVHTNAPVEFAQYALLDEHGIWIGERKHND